MSCTFWFITWAQINKGLFIIAEAFLLFEILRVHLLPHRVVFCVYIIYIYRFRGLTMDGHMEKRLR